MGDFTVDRKQLTAGQKSFSTLVKTGETIHTALTSVPLSQPDFGRVPWLQSRVWDAYVEHTQDCNSSLTELTGALQNVSDGLGSAAAAYRITDEAAEQAAHYIVSSMNAGPA